MTKTVDQKGLAEELAEELGVCGHEIAGIDILDALASTGLRLDRTLINEASDAYLDSMEGQ